MANNTSQQRSQFSRISRAVGSHSYAFGNGKQVQMEICLITPFPESDNGHEIPLKPGAVS